MPTMATCRKTLSRLGNVRNLSETKVATNNSRRRPMTIPSCCLAIGKRFARNLRRTGSKASAIAMPFFWSDCGRLNDSVLSGILASKTGSHLSFTQDDVLFGETENLFHIRRDQQDSNLFFCEPLDR